jgi:enamine deaminase RidA (YjgF/YER057c/UK114 family)
MLVRHGLTPIMHRVVRHGDIIHFGGITADDRSAGISGQTTQILNKIGRLLEEAGSDESCVLSATVFITDLDLKEEMNAAWTAWFAPENLPARATIGVADLGKDVLLEVVITACARVA